MGKVDKDEQFLKEIFSSIMQQLYIYRTIFVDNQNIKYLLNNFQYEKLFLQKGKGKKYKLR